MGLEGAYPVYKGAETGLPDEQTPADFKMTAVKTGKKFF